MSNPVTQLLDTIAEGSVVGSFSKLGIKLRRRITDWTPLGQLDLRGRTVLVTGANSGLGYAIAEQCARNGADLRILVRSESKGRDTLDRIREAIGPVGAGAITMGYGVADLADFSSVRAFAEEFMANETRLDVLINNAGAMFPERTQVEDGIEKTIAVHVVGPFILTSALLPILSDRPADDPSRVITMASGGMYGQKLSVRHLQSPKDFKPATAYARAKRAQVVLNRKWAEHVTGGDVVFHVMHPGWAETPGVEDAMPIFNKVMGGLLRTPLEGGDTAVWLAASEDGAVQQDGIWLDREVRGEHKLPSTKADPAEEDLLWDEVVRLAGTDPTKRVTA